MQTVIGIIGVKGAGKDTAASFLIEKGYRRIGFADTLYQEVADAFSVTPAFLNRRETKETDLPELALANCADKAFVEVVVEELARESSHAEVVRGDGGLLTNVFKKIKALFSKTVKSAEVSTVNDWLTAPRSPRFIMQRWGVEYRRKKILDSYWLDQVHAAIRANPTTNFVVTDVRFKNEAQFVRQLGGILVRVRRPELEAKEALSRIAQGTAAHSSETELLEYSVDHELFNVEGAPAVLGTGILNVAGFSEELIAA